jgi:MoaA/NifB/PqqE/SkfB family radical SAM enzyme
MGFSIGIGLTNNCNLNCAHCYRDSSDIRNIRLDQIQRLCESLPVDSLGMGTGENVLNPEFIPIVDYLSGRNIRLSIASNGYTLTTIPDKTLHAFHDVEVSIDFPTRAEQDDFRGEGNWDLVHRAIRRCHEAGLKVSILTTLMNTNFGRMADLLALARNNETYLRVNVYQPVKSGDFRLEYNQFWQAYRELFAAGKVISCSEPVVRAAMGLKEVKSPCARESIRFNPRGEAIPCVYWPLDGQIPPLLDDIPRFGEDIINHESFHLARGVPPAASDCPCQGGCASRRALNGALDAHDEYCPWVRGENVSLAWEATPHQELMRSRNVCTTIVV